MQFGNLESMPQLNYENVGLLMWAIIQETHDKKQWLTKQIIEK